MSSGSISVRETGVIKAVKKTILKVEGLSSCMLGELVVLPDENKGMVMGFNEKEVLVLLLGFPQEIKAGASVYLQGETFKIPVSEEYPGRIISPLGEPLDGKGPAAPDGAYPVFRDAPGVLERVPVSEMMRTGIRSIDTCLPIGKGQRQLIIGDRMTGKTTLALDTILNQKGRGVVCIYCLIGKDHVSLEKVIGTLKKHEALDYTVIVPALASSTVGEQYLAPYAAAAIGEYFMYSGRDTLVVFDDLTKHAWAYRELSLLLERPPGREAYPGDVFYLHAQVMERAARLSAAAGGGSMTFLPIADTLEGDIAGFIPTNLISMTDGQIYLNSALFGEGFKPAVDLGLSVSRIGSRVQPAFLKELSKDLGLRYLQYRELLKTTKLRAVLSEEMQNRLRHGVKIESLIKQDRNMPSSMAEEAIFFYALKTGVLEVLSDENMESFKSGITEFIRGKYPEMIDRLNEGGMPEEREKKLVNEAMIEFFREG
ncbi:MAG: F0F1 ATP synthase subunit alpha [Candidatus Omnitrophota bacterium]